MNGTDFAIGLAVLAVAFVVVFMVAGAFNLPVPQWLLAAVAAGLGVIVWFAILQRRRA
jgi:uncharacterized protein (DUF983 family)